MGGSWRTSRGLAATGALVALAVLSLIAGSERRGLTWWDALIVVGVAGAAFFLAERLGGSRG